MTKEEINKLIVESNLLITTVTNGYQVWMPENIEKFANLVAKTEREACAKVCENIATQIYGMTKLREYGECAQFIRARGQG